MFKKKHAVVKIISAIDLAITDPTMKNIIYFISRE